MLTRMWRKGNSCVLLVERQIGASTVENSMESSQKIKNRMTIQSSNSTSGYLLKEMKTLIQKDSYIPKLTAELFTITSI